MKTNKIDLDLDFIGGQGWLTKVEEKQLSDYFKSRKLSTRRNIRQQKTIITRSNVVA
jgi:hypothetical protein